MRIIIVFLLIASSYLLMGNELTTVEYVDLNRYLGLWYQIAYFPTWFQKQDCPLTTAEYSLRDDGKIRVYNACWADSAGGKLVKDSTGKAWVTDPSGSKLKVSFFWPFSGNYWIIMLDEDNYQWAVVSEPKRKYLWILCRQVKMDPVLYAEILDILEQRDFDLEKLIKTS